MNSANSDLKNDGQTLRRIMSSSLLESLPLCVRICRGTLQLPGPGAQYRLDIDFVSKTFLTSRTAFFHLARTLSFQEWKTAFESLDTITKPLQSPLYYHIMLARVRRQSGGRMMLGKHNCFLQRKCSRRDCGKMAAVLDGGVLLCADCAISRAKKGRAGEELRHAVFDAARRDRHDAVCTLGRAQQAARLWSFFTESRDVTPS